ncbi:MAG: hypothetical protein WAO90_03840, partial [Mycobacterium sp.]
MSDSCSADVTSKHLESAGQVRAIRSARRSATGSIGTSVGGGYVRYVGRVGALAVALGVGSAVAAMPVAFADE